MFSTSCLRILLGRQPHYLFMRSGHPPHKRRVARRQIIRGHILNNFMLLHCDWRYKRFNALSSACTSQTVFFFFKTRRQKTMMAFHLANAALSGWHLGERKQSFISSQINYDADTRQNCGNGGTQCCRPVDMGEKTLRHDDGFTHGQHCHHFWWHLRLKIEQHMLWPVDRMGCELVDRLFKPTLLQLSFTVVQRITSVRNVSNTNIKKKEPLADRCLLLAPLHWTNQQPLRRKRREPLAESFSNR